MNLLTIADALAARFAPGVTTAPAGRKAITTSTARPPNAIPNTPFVITWAQEGTLTYAPGQRRGEHTFQVVFHYSKSEADIPREYAALMDWVGVLLDQLHAQMTLGVTGVMKAMIARWEIGAVVYAGITYEAITLTVTVWTEESVTLVP